MQIIMLKLTFSEISSNAFQKKRIRFSQRFHENEASLWVRWAWTGKHFRSRYLIISRFPEKYIAQKMFKKIVYSTVGFILAAVNESWPPSSYVLLLSRWVFSFILKRLVTGGCCEIHLASHNMAQTQQTFHTQWRNSI